jgi:WD40 repeat protein
MLCQLLPDLFQKNHRSANSIVIADEALGRVAEKAHIIGNLQRRKNMQSRSIMATIALIVIFCTTVATQENNEVYEIVQVKQLEFSMVSDIKWSPDGSRLAIVEFPSIHILDTRTWDTIQVINDANVSSIQWSPDGTKIASVRGGFNESLLIWDVNSGEMLERFDRNEEDRGNGTIFLSRLSWSPDGTKIASDSSSLDLLVWDVQDGDIVVVEGHEENGVVETDWSPDSDRIVSGGADGTIRVWDAETGEQILTLEGGGFVDWHPTGDQLVGSSPDGNFVIVWDAQSGEEQFRTELIYPILYVRWNHDGTC